MAIIILDSTIIQANYASTLTRPPDQFVSDRAMAQGLCALLWAIIAGPTVVGITFVASLLLGWNGISTTALGF
jgi:hypothetical protein